MLSLLFFVLCFFFMCCRIESEAAGFSCRCPGVHRLRGSAGGALSGTPWLRPRRMWNHFWMPPRPGVSCVQIEILHSSLQPLRATIHRPKVPYPYEMAFGPMPHMSKNRVILNPYGRWVVLPPLSCHVDAALCHVAAAHR